jgi:hypothetical protein
MVIERSGGPASENLPFWANFIRTKSFTSLNNFIFLILFYLLDVGMTDRYFNHWETQPLFLGLCKIVKERMFDPWPCITHAYLFIKLIRLGLGSDPVQFTEKGNGRSQSHSSLTPFRRKFNVLCHHYE